MNREAPASSQHRWQDRMGRLAARWRSASVVRRAGFLACFCAVLFVLVNWRNYAPDTISQALLPVCMWRDGALHLDRYRDYYDQLKRERKEYSFTEGANGHLYARNSVFVAMLVAPLYLPPVLAGVPAEGPMRIAVFGWDSGKDWREFWLGWARVSAAVWAGIAVALVYLTLRRWRDEGPALAFSLLLGFGTCVWTNLGQTTYDHLAMVPIAALVLALTDFPLRPSRAGLAAFLMGAAVGMRPCTVVLLFPLGAYLFFWPGTLAGWRARASAVVGLLLVPLATAYLNARMFGHWYTTGYPNDLASWWTNPPWEGGPGLLISPNMGLLIQSPFLILALVGGWLAWRRPGLPERGLLRAYTICIVVYWLLFAHRNEWEGGQTFSSRYLSEGYPLWMALVLVGWNAERNRPGALALVTSAGIWAVFYQLLGIATFDAYTILRDPATGGPIWNVAWDPRASFLAWHLSGYGLLPTLAAIARTLAWFALCATGAGYVLAPFFLPPLRSTSAVDCPNSNRTAAQPSGRTV